MAQRRHYLKVAITDAQKRALASAQTRMQAESVSDVVRAAIDRFNEQTTLEQSLHSAMADLRETGDSMREEMRETCEAGVSALATQGAELLHAMSAQHLDIVKAITAFLDVMEKNVGKPPAKKA